jgi:hypothetical protein
MSTSSEKYNADYYLRGVECGLSLYSHYEWRPELTIPMAARMCEELQIPVGSKILDVGCARGYLVHAMSLLGRDAYGVDCSPWAIFNAHEAPREQDRVAIVPENWNVFAYSRWSFNIAIAKDVFEHMDEHTLTTCLRALHGCSQRVFVIVPLGDGEKYIIPSHELDVTHVIRQTAMWWRGRLMEAGWSVHSLLPPSWVKQDWTAKWPDGFAFLVGSRA